VPAAGSPFVADARDETKGYLRAHAAPRVGGESQRSAGADTADLAAGWLRAIARPTPVGSATSDPIRVRERHLDCRPSLPIPVRTRCPHGVRIPMNAPLPV